MSSLSDIIISLSLLLLLSCCLRTQQKVFSNKNNRPRFVKKTPVFSHRKKPQWVTDKVIRLKAFNPDYGCRKIAYTFNRLYEHKNQSVSKSFVYEKLKQHQYQILLLQRKIKHQRPVPVPGNQKWGMDLTTVTDATGAKNQILAIIDYGTRKCLCLQRLESKYTANIIRTLIRTMTQYGSPKYLKTDN